MDCRPVSIFEEENRRPTNQIWIFPFLVAVATFIVFATVASRTNGPSGVVLDTVISNAAGSQCGIDSNVLDKYLRIRVDQRKCGQNLDYIDGCDNSWICVKSCPEGSFDASTCTPNTFASLKEHLVCQDEKLKSSIADCGQLISAVQAKKCVAWYENTHEIFGRCFSRESNRHDSDDVKIEALEAHFGQIILSLLPSFIYGCVIAGVVSLFFAVTLKWSAFFVFWGFIVLVYAALTISLICVAIKTISNDHPASPDELNALQWQIGLLGVFMAIFGLFLYFLRRKIRCGIEIVKESSHCVCASVGSIFFPVLPFLLRAGVIILGSYVVVMAWCMMDNRYEIAGKDENSDCHCNNSIYSNGASCDPEIFNADCRAADGGICMETSCKLISQTESSFSGPLIILTVMIATWIVAFIQANAKMILAHVYGNWYWNWNRQFIPGGAVVTAMTKILPNHLGTAAFGGFVVMICRVLKNLLSRRQHSGMNSIGALIARVVVEIIRCFAYMIIDLIEFVSDKAFVVVAVTGYGFWDSVKTVSRIMVRDAPLVVATEYVGDIILFVCKFVSAGLAAGLFYVASPFKAGDDAYITIYATVLIFLFAFDLAAVFLTAYNVAIDTLLICTIHDYMHSGVEKAYFKSQTLNGLLLKKEIDNV
ncbi:choline transporter-like 2 [Culicoides brevitarsis]|uniref:choline transporter-like 2 n=1 Tax=Culicoides brevitarsis TaxID=469753 RepID=UPI00307CB001